MTISAAAGMASVAMKLSATLSLPTPPATCCESRALPRNRSRMSRVTLLEPVKRRYGALERDAKLSEFFCFFFQLSNRIIRLPFPSML